MARVIVIGGANVDIKGRAGSAYMAGTSNPGTVTLSAGGVGRNIAENLGRLGVPVALLTALGDDQYAEFLRKRCAEARIDMSLAMTVRGATGTYLAVLDEKGEMMSAVSDTSAIEGFTPDHLASASRKLSEADLLVADCNMRSECLAWLCRFAARGGQRLLIEPVSVPKATKLLEFGRPDPVFAITPNAQQLHALSGGDIQRLHALGFANVVVHHGSAGALASDGAMQAKISPVPVSSVADVTGAGDAAVAGLICGLLEGRSLAQAAQLGQCAAAIKLSSAQSVASGLSLDSLHRVFASLPLGGRVTETLRSLH